MSFRFFNMKVCCVCSCKNRLIEAILTNTHKMPSSNTKKKKKIPLNYPKSAAMGFFEGTQNDFETVVVTSHQCSSH